MGIDRSDVSPGLQQKLVYAGANNTSFAQADRNVAELMDLKVGPKPIERMTERAGEQRCAERDAEVERYMSLPLVERKDAPEGVEAPDAVVVSVDGGRVQILDRSQTKPATEAAAEAEQALEPDTQHRGTHWYEDKIAEFMTLDSEEHKSDPCPEIPEVFVDPTRIVKLTRELKTKKSAQVQGGDEELAKPDESADATPEVQRVLKEEPGNGEWEAPEVKTKEFQATRRPWAAFGPMVACMAWLLGFYKSPRKGFVADGASTNWTLWQNHFSSFTPILDIIHAISYVFAAAMAGRPFAEGWVCYVRWVRWVWQGQVAKVLKELAQRQAEVGLPQEGDGETHVRQVVSTALGYLQNHADKMRYDEYRRLGLPITSSYVESAIKQFNQRVKGTEKFWSEKGVEALLQLRGDYLSDADPMVEFWERRVENETGQRPYNTLAV